MIGYVHHSVSTIQNPFRDSARNAGGHCYYCFETPWQTFFPLDCIFEIINDVTQKTINCTLSVIQVFPFFWAFYFLS